MVSTQTAMPPPAPPPAVSTSMSIQQPVNTSPSPVGVMAGSANSVAVSQVHSHVTTSVQQQSPLQSTISMPQSPISVHQSPISVPQSQISVPQHSSTCTVIPQQTIQSMAQSHLQPVQVIQQPLHNHAAAAYLPQLYSAAQQQMLLSGNLTLGPHGMGTTLQGLNLQLQGKPHGSPVDHTKAGQTAPHGTATATIIPAVSIAGMAQTGAKGVQGVTISTAPTLVSSNGQFVTGGKPCLPGGQMLAKGATAMMGPAGYVPSTSTAAHHQHQPQHQQTLVINHLGLLSSQGLLPAQATQGAKPMDPQKAKPYVMSQQTPLQPKSPLLTSQAAAGATAAAVQQGAGVTTAQVLNPNQFKQLQQGSQPQLISSQPPHTVISQAQLLGSLQALNATFPHGITWANPGQLQSPTTALLTAQNPIYIRSQQPDMFLQQGGTTLHAVPVAAPVAPPQQQQQPQQVVAAPQPQQAPPIQPQQQQPIQQQQPQQQQQQQPQQHPQQPQQPKPKQVRPASSVATQTATSTAVTVNSHVIPSRPQVKPRARTQTNRNSPGPGHQHTMVHTQTANTQTQTFPAQQLQAQQHHHHHHQHQQNIQHQFQHQIQPQQMHHHHPQPKADAANQTTVTPQQSGQQSLQHQHHHHHPHHQHPPIQPRILPEMKSTATQSTKTNIPIEPKPASAPQQSPHVTTSHVGANHIGTTTNNNSNNNAGTPVSHIPTSHVQTSHTVSSHVTSTHVAASQAVVTPHQKACSTVPSPPMAAPPPTTIKASTAEDKVEVSTPPEAAMPYDKQGGQQGEKVDAITNGGAVTPQMTMLTASEPVKQSPQKAVVKPNVLTHVIEGYIIQEGPEPFPVSRSSLIAESESPKPAPETNGKASDAEVLQQVAQVPAEPEHVELATCEMCGKLGTKAKFKKSKRFCSSSCVKRHNHACSERLGIFTFSPEPEDDDFPGKITKKKKVGRKSWRKMQGGRTPSYSTDEWTKPDLPGLDNVQPGPESNSEGNHCQDKGDNSMEMEGVGGNAPPQPEGAISPAVAPQDEMEVDAAEPAPPLPSKSLRTWTVQEVADYIQELPGCADYAEEFRSQEIDGQALLLLKEDHLMSAMSIKLGPALKICAKINALREEQ